MKAFVEAVEAHDDRLRALCFQMVGDSDDVSDLLQESYLKAYKALPSFRGESSLSTWLYRIVFRTCVDHLRSTKRRPTCSTDELPEPQDPAPQPSELTERFGTLGKALASLPVEQRAAVFLVDAAEFGYAEAADVLGEAVGTVASRVARARGSLRAALRRSDTDGEL